MNFQQGTAPAGNSRVHAQPAVFLRSVPEHAAPAQLASVVFSSRLAGWRVVYN